MDSAAKLRDQYRQAREAGDYETSAAAASQVWQDDPDHDAWDAWNLAIALRKTDHAAEAYKIAWEGLQLVSEGASGDGSVGERLASEYGWSVYNAELKNGATSSPARVAKAAVSVVNVWERHAVERPWTSQFCPVPLVVNKAMKLLKDARAWSHLADVAAATDGDRMPDEPMRPDAADDPRGNWTRAEAWYVSAAKAYVEEGRYDDAEAIVARGADREPSLGQHCLRWLYFHGAKAAIGRGEGARALEMVAGARRRGVNDWWMGVTEAQAAQLAGERVTALTALADAFVSADQGHVPPEFLCSALDTATQLMAEEHPDLASKCARVNRGIRESRGWSISEGLEAASGGVSEPDSALTEIIAGWQAFQRSMQPRGSGTVTRVLSEGSGFIRDDDEVDRYFSLPGGSAKPEWLVEGAHVAFRPIQRMDRKAGVEKPAADDIEAA